MPETVTILGAGIVGICTALSLAERGVSVQVIDRASPGQETSFGNAGIISPWSIVPQALPGTWRLIPSLVFGRTRALSIRPSALPSMVPWGLSFLRNGTEAKVRASSDAMGLLCGPSIDLYRRHLAGTGSEHLVADAMYVHAFRDGSRANVTSLDYTIRREKGAEVELVGKDELHRMEPALSPAFNAAILIKGQARALAPGHIGTVLAEKAKSLGVEFLRLDVQGISREENGWRITCLGIEIKAKQIVISLGAWSLKLLKPLGLRLPLMAERGYHVEFPNAGIELNNSVMDVDAKCVGSSMEGGLRFAGQAEFGRVDAPADDRKRTHLIKLAKAAFPDLNTNSPSFWLGRRPSFPDSLPMLGEVANHEGLFFNFGHSHYGLMMAPKSGEVIADLICNTHPNADLTPFSPTRF